VDVKETQKAQTEAFIEQLKSISDEMDKTAKRLEEQQ
jgi:hypothetical protein